MRKKPSNVPVFLIYAGLIHAIGLALLLPMLITLPGPGSEVATESATIDVEIVPGSPLGGRADPEGEQTSALPSGAAAGDAAGVKPGSETETANPPDPEVEPQQEQENAPQEEPEKADNEEPDTSKAEAAKVLQAYGGEICQ